MLRCSRFVIHSRYSSQLLIVNRSFCTPEPPRPPNQKKVDKDAKKLEREERQKLKKENRLHHIEAHKKEADKKKPKVEKVKGPLGAVDYNTDDEFSTQKKKSSKKEKAQDAFLRTLDPEKL